MPASVVCILVWRTNLCLVHKPAIRGLLQNMTYHDARLSVAPGSVWIHLSWFDDCLQVADKFSTVTIAREMYGCGPTPQIVAGIYTIRG